MSETPAPYTMLEGGSATTPTGWHAAAVACGLRYSGRPDLALLVSDGPSNAAALFTTNAVQSAHIQYDRPLLERNPAGLRAVLINSGSANACTGSAGVEAAAASAQRVEQALGLPADSTFVMSTGVIGLALNMEKLLPGVDQAAQQLAAEHGPAAAAAIMTTDTRPKHCAVRVDLPGGQHCHIGGMAKGSGMIHPDMATMLGIITTDASLPPATLKAALRYAADRSFNSISVDGDTSTNDTLLALANGLAGLPAIDDLASPEGQAFLAGLVAVCQYLAREVVRDGEGANRLVTIHVRGAASDADARQAAMAVARSPLVKTAMFAADPYSGRVVCALGYSKAMLDPAKLVLTFCGVEVFRHGLPTEFDEQAAHELMSAPEVEIVADMGLGSGSATVWTCDFSYEYVRINAEYRS